MKPRFNAWLDVDGKVALSAWRVRLLEAVQETGSITAAAERLSVPYRRAWEKIHEMESALGSGLLDTQVGGPHGGGARLTAEAQDLIARFHHFSDGLDREVEDRFAAAFRSHEGQA
jgi:molybdate transport system regulatory protein